MAQAFSNIRILDFSAVLSAPVAVMQLGLLGAEIIKIEQPNVGDQLRSIMNEVHCLLYTSDAAYDLL